MGFIQYYRQRSLVSCRCGFRSSFLSARTERCCENPAYDSPRTPQCNLQFVTRWALFIYLILILIVCQFFVSVGIVGSFVILDLVRACANYKWAYNSKGLICLLFFLVLVRIALTVCLLSLNHQLSPYIEDILFEILEEFYPWLFLSWQNSMFEIWLATL